MKTFLRCLILAAAFVVAAGMNAQATNDVGSAPSGANPVKVFANAATDLAGYGVYTPAQVPARLSDNRWKGNSSKDSECVPKTWITGDSTGSSYYVPLNNYYNYSLTETLIEAGEIGGPMIIDTIQYHYRYSSAMTDKDNVTIWIQPTTKSAFSSSSDIVALDTTIAVQVYSGPMNFSFGWNDIALTTPYSFDGTTNLLIIVDDNSGDYNGNSYTFSTASCSGYKSISWYSDSQNPDPLNTSAFSGSKGYYQYRVRMALKGCDLATCPAPTNFAVSDITTNGATLTWNPNGTGATYTIYNMADNSVVATGLTSTSYVLTGLTPNTDYLFGLEANCSADDASLLLNVGFHTACVAFSVPFFEDFDSYTTSTTAATGVEPNCWTLAHQDVSWTSASYYPQLYYSSAHAHSGSYSLRLYYRGIYALPAMDTNINLLQMNFWVRQTSTSYQLAVGVMSDLADETTFVPIDTIICSSTSAPEEHTVYFNNYTGNGRYIAFRNITTSTYSYSYNYIDDVSVSFLPTCIPVDNLAATGVTHNGATLTWTASSNPSATYTVYNIADSSVVATDLTTNSFVLTGLAPVTSYLYGVVTNCSATESSSLVTVGFQTPCAPYAVPFFEDFDSYTTSTTAATGVEPNCWTLAHQDVSWTSASYYPQLYYSSAHAHSGSYSLRLYYRGIYALPAMDTNINLLQMNFWVRQTAASYRLVVGVMSDLADETTFVPIDTIICSSTSATEEHTVFFNNYTGNGRYIAFRNITTSTNSYSYNYIDDVSVNFLPTCLPVDNLAATNIDAHGATITWVDNTNTGATYTIYVDSTVVASNVTGNSYTFSGLLAHNSYTVGVQVNCSATDFTGIEYVTFSTLSEPIMCGGDVATTISNADSSTTTTNYFPGYSTYNYSYTEVIIPASRLGNLSEIKGLQFKPNNVAAGSNRFNNCEIYMMNTTATSLTDGFIQDTDNFQLVFTGSLNYDNTNWQQVTFDNSFIWNGTDNVVVAVRRNNGSWASTGQFAAFSSTEQLARYIYRDNSAYEIGTITGGTATSSVPIYQLIGCPADNCGSTCQITIEGEDSYGDGWNGGYITVFQNNEVVDTFVVSDETYAKAITVCSNYPVVLQWNEGSYDDEVSFTIYDGGNNVQYVCNSADVITPNIPFATIATPCPSCLGVTATVSSYTNNTVTLSWVGNDAGSYNIYNDTTLVASAISDTTYTFTSLTGHTTYNFGLQAVCTPTDASSISYVTVTTLSDPLLCDSLPAPVFSNADSATATTNYFPGYSTYNYSYSEVIIPASNLGNLAEIKGLEFKPQNIAAGSSYFNNCEIYMMNTTATSLADGFIQDTTNFQLVYTGSLNYSDTNWQLVPFDNSFLRDGSNVLVAVRRNNGTWASTGQFAAFSSTEQLARYIYRDNSAYEIGTITGGTATSSVPIYQLIGCPADNCGSTCQITIEGEDSYGDGWNGGYITVFQNNEVVDTFVVSDETYAKAITVCSNYPVVLQWNEGSYDDEVSFTIYDGGNNVQYVCNSADVITPNIPFATIATPCPSCLGVTATVSSYTNNTVTLSWVGNDAGSYNIYNDTNLVASAISDTTYTFTGLTGHTTYNFGVQTACSATEASSINYVTVTTLSDPIMCDSILATFVSNADSINSTTNYFPGTCYFNYSYTEVIIPASRLGNLGEIKGFEFKPTTVANGSSYYNNCEVYLMNTTATSLASGFIQDTTNFQLVYTGSLNYSDTNWQLVTFDNSFLRDGTNVLVAVRRNHGAYTSSIPYAAYQGTDTLARYVQRDNNAYEIGTITGGTATTTIPVYHLIGCEGILPPPSTTVTVATANPAMGTTIPAPGTYSYNVGDTITLQAVAAPGHAFSYWVVDLGFYADTLHANPISQEVMSYMAGMNLNITAHFEVNPLTVTVVNDQPFKGTIVPYPGTYQYNVGDTIVASATANYGYSFGSWTLDLGLFDTTFSMNPAVFVVPAFLAGQSVTFSVNWVNNEYTLTVTTPDTTLGTVTGGGVYPYGSSVTIEATPKPNCHFVSWSDGSTDAVHAVAVSGDTTYVATFAYDSVTVVLSVNDAATGTIVPAAGTYTYAVGDTLTVEALPNEGYEFVRWIYSGTAPLIDQTVNPFTMVLTPAQAGQTVTFNALFQAIPQYTVYLSVRDSLGNANVGGIVTGAGTYYVDDEVFITANPDANYHFVHWIDETTGQVVSTSHEYSFSMPASHLSYVAVFAADVVGIDDVDLDNIVIYSSNQQIIVQGANGQTIRVFDVVGRLVAQRQDATDQESIQLSNTGVYLVQVGNAPARRVVVRR